MDRAEVLEVVRDKAVELLGVEPDEVQEERAFAELGDSLQLVELCMDVEDALGIELPEDGVTAARTVSAFVDLVEHALGTALNSDG